MTQTPPVDEVRIAEAVRVLEAGGLLALPTENLYRLPPHAPKQSPLLSPRKAGAGMGVPAG